MLLAVKQTPSWKANTNPKPQGRYALRLCFHKLLVLSSNPQLTSDYKPVQLQLIFGEPPPWPPVPPQAPLYFAPALKVKHLTCT